MSDKSILNNLQDYAESFIQTHNIPALSLAVWQKNTLTVAAAGCLNQDTGVTATTDSIFQIGSITKVMTASLVMQLVDEGKVDLDRPVKHYLRDFMVADAGATEAITVRQLLNHTSGIAGDFFPDDHGYEGNLIARYVDRCSMLPLVHPVGEMYSYSNAAFCVAGRLIEVVRGISWYQAMDEYLYQPLGMELAIADPKDVIRYRCAMGHVFDGDNADKWVLPERVYFTLGQAPVGTTPAMSAENLTRFARAHMEDGLNQQGEPWLSADAIQQMQRSEIELPKLSQTGSKHASLGWGFNDYDRADLSDGSGCLSSSDSSSSSDSNTTPLRVIGHGGATNGFLSMLQFIPEQNAAFAVLMNGFRSSAMAAATGDLLGALTGIDLNQPEPNSTASLDQLTPITGIYESLDTHITVVEQGSKLLATVVYKIDPLPPLHLVLKHVEDLCFAPYTKEGQRVPNIGFLKPNAEGVPQYLYYGGRLTPRL